MELGATVCTAGAAGVREVPDQGSCAGHAGGRAMELPVNSGKKEAEDIALAVRVILRKTRAGEEVS